MSVKLGIGYRHLHDEETCKPNPFIMEQKFYRIRQIIGDPKKGIPAIIPVSRATWYKAVAEGRFPKPVRLTEKTAAWRASDIDALVERLNNGMNDAPKRDGAA